jgi:hypothetical protein
MDSEAIEDLLTWLEEAELPPPPLRSMPGVEHYNVELMRKQFLEFVPAGDNIALLKLRYLAARYGPPKVRALAPPRAPARPNLPPVLSCSSPARPSSGGRTSFCTLSWCQSAELAVFSWSVWWASSNRQSCAA